MRGPDPDLAADAEFGERFASCVERNGGIQTLAVLGVALGIDFLGVPLPKTPAELRGLGGTGSLNTTRLSRFNVGFNDWLKGHRIGSHVRGFRVAGRITSAIRPVTNVVGAAAAGYAIGLVPGCAISAAE